MTDPVPEAPPSRRPNLLRRMYAWTAAWADRPSSAVALFLIAFAEASFFPIPPDVLLLAIIGAQPKRGLRMAAVCTAGSVLGGLFGYLIGYAIEPVGNWLLGLFATEAQIDRVKTLYAENAFLAVLGAAVTPIPYKVFTISAGFSRISLGAFVAASILGRGARFFAEGLVLYFVGPRAKPFVERNLEWLSVAFFLLLIAGFAAISLLGARE
jgi:membrane protein YqaA with SNARE-associated domain